MLDGSQCLIEAKQVGISKYYTALTWLHHKIKDTSNKAVPAFDSYIRFFIYKKCRVDFIRKNLYVRKAIKTLHKTLTM
ncbi:MAG: hypothetical protein A2W80_11615 [Candidatus Riflebacteria bacterium GWC2_50_8]|nr:MAG: hypothetical protein A2W80_11615 [Candidatus Riflebacteria bacterium GWC2_50_8]